MKQIIACTLAIIMLFTFAACNSSDSSTGSNSGNSTNPSNTQPTTSDNKPDPTVPSNSHPDGSDPTEPTEHLHRYVYTETKAPTCLEKGEGVHICECGDQYVTEIQAIGHRYEIISTTEATCAKEGEITYACHCGDSYVEYIPSPEHNWGVWFETVHPTMTSTGQAERHCIVCNFTETMELDPISTEEAIYRLVCCITELPTFQSPDDLSAGFLFDWVRLFTDKVSSEWNDETFEITIVYSLDAFDEFTNYYLGRTYDFVYLTEVNDDMTYDAENNYLIWVTYGAGGYNYMQMDSYEQIDDTHYVVRYAAYSPEDEDAIYYGTLHLNLVDGRFIIESHSNECE